MLKLFKFRIQLGGKFRDSAGEGYRCEDKKAGIRDVVQRLLVFNYHADARTRQVCPW